MKILIVDDDQFTRRVVARILANLGISSVQQAGDGSEALRMVMDDPPDLIISDVHMKPMDGLTFALSLRNLGGLVDAERIRLVFMTSDERREVNEVAGQLKCDGFLVKPVTIEKARNLLAQFAMKWD